MSIDGGVSSSSDSYVIRAGRMWVFCCELFVSQDPHGIANADDSVGVIARCSGDPIDRFGLGDVDRCSKSGVDRHQCDPPKLIRLSTSLLPAASLPSPLAKNHPQ
ncbi:hypothetical protein F2Q70_00016876 [Brassica cretica]|uniref:Uncharacterized protein n=1 Tax=Brassica cretica TaxID=69181 RepID=A0A8S9I154_BRACR|nr:hypothetical protein F2Q70_00016876 [Brassica cretica]